MPRAPVYDRNDEEPVTGPDLGRLEEAPNTPAELLERIPTMSDKDASKLDKRRGLNDTAKHLKNDEEGAGTKNRPGPSDHPDKFPGGYKSETKGQLMAERSWIRRWVLGKRGLVGGGIGGVLVGSLIWGFTIVQGPLQFIHMAQLLGQFHLSSQEDMSDDRFSKMARFVSRGFDARETRVGILGSKYARTIEGKMNATGIQSTYTDGLKYYNGFTVDPNNEKFKGMTNDEIKQYFKENYGVELITPDELTDATPEQKAALKEKGKLVASAKGMGFFAKKGLIKAQLQESGYSKISAAVHARVMGRYGGVTWHPVKRADAALNQKLADLYIKLRKKYNGQVKDGAKSIFIADTEEMQVINENDSPEVKRLKAELNDNAHSAHEHIAGVNDEASATHQAIEDNGDTTALDKFKAHTSLRIAGGGAAALGVLCMIRAMDKNVDDIKYAQVVLPALRMGMDTVALGHQVMDGGDLDSQQLQWYAQKFNSKEGSWIEARSIQGELGQSQTGPEASDALQTINKGSPFAFINEGDLGKLLPAACSKIGQGIIGGISLGISLLTGTFLGQISGTIVTAVAAGPIMDRIAHYLAGEAINPNDSGPDFGNDSNYGVKLAANNQAVSSGGRELSDQESGQLSMIEATNAKQEFDKRSIAHKLFSPTDEYSMVAKVIDRSSPSFSQNTGNLASAFFNFGNIGHSLASLPNLFTRPALAAGHYDYGFPTYGFSIEEMNDPSVENPYDNARIVAGILDGNSVQGASTTQGGQVLGASTSGANGKVLAASTGYFKKAAKCFGVTFVKSGGVWDVQRSGIPNMYAQSSDPYKAKGCDDRSDPNWKRIRFFIFDTGAMKGVACFIGDKQSCQDEDFISNEAGGGGAARCDSPGFAPYDPGKWNALPGNLKAAIEANAPLRTDRGAACGAIPNAHPSDPTRQYMGECHYGDCIPGACDGSTYGPIDHAAEKWPGRICIGVKYRDPLAGQNSTVFPIDGSGNSGGGDNGGNNGGGDVCRVGHPC